MPPIYYLQNTMQVFFITH